MIRISCRGTASKCVVIGAAALTLAAVTLWIGRVYAASVVARQPIVPNLEKASRLDPGNAEYRLELSRLYQYNLPDIDPDKAVASLGEAVRLNAYEPQAWLDLGAALELQGKTAQADACLRRAHFVAPNLPGFQWAIANYFLLHGNTSDAFSHFRNVLAGTDHYNQAIFSLVWKASGDGNQILDEVIPDRPDREFAYLYYLIGQKKVSESDSVWARIAAESNSFPASWAGGYIDFMVDLHRVDDAYSVWQTLVRKNLMRSTAVETRENLIINGDFEEDLLNFGFDWRVTPAPEIYAGLDDSSSHSPSHSMLVQFSGKQNVFYRHVTQMLRVTPGHPYRLSWAMRTEGITTDSGPRIEVWDRFDPKALDVLSDSITGTTPWSSQTMDFKAGPKTNLIVVAIARVPSRKLDSLIVGSIWVDDFDLIDLTGSSQPETKK